MEADSRRFAAADAQSGGTEGGGEDVPARGGGTVGGGGTVSRAVAGRPSERVCFRPRLSPGMEEEDKSDRRAKEVIRMHAYKAGGEGRGGEGEGRTGEPASN